MFDWDDLRIFLAVTRHRRLGEAARALELDPTTLGRRLARLSRALDAELFEITGGERRLTDRGQALLTHAEAIESAALSAVGDVTGEAARLSGQVRLSVAEGFASRLLAPRVARFHADHPAIALELVTASGILDPSKREADVAVMLARPRSGRLIASKLADYGLRLYAARSYGRPLPQDRAALRRHPLIGYLPEFLYAPQLDYLSEIAPGLEPQFRSTSITVQHRMIAGGAGLGVLPRFIGDEDPALVPVLPEEVGIRRSFWLVTHSDLRRLARIEAVTRWLKACGAALT